jgi:ATP-dependent exoDNAse (exonuclease V) beta subunit
MPLQQGYIQVMTIHQAKGLEFPVVVVELQEREIERLLQRV